jgi:hypothetical protein
MDCSPRTFSSPRPGRTDVRRLPLILAASLAGAGCGHGDRQADAQPPAVTRVAEPTPAPAGADPSADAPPPRTEALCVPSDQGYLRARLQGSIEADLDWAANVQQCRGGLRPSKDGVRLLFKGPGATPEESLLIVIGIGPLRPGESRTQVPVNLTVVQEGAGQFFATQGDDKCAMDEVHQESQGETLFRLTGRGYCTQPARAVQGDGAVLVSRFDVEAVVDFAEAIADSTYARLDR